MMIAAAVIGSVAAVITIVLGGRSLYRSLRASWVREHALSLSLTRLTKAVEGLTGRMGTVEKALDTLVQGPDRK